MELLKILRVKDKDGNIHSYNVGFSANDFNNELKAKLDAIEEGAQVNVIEKIRLNGKDIVVSSDGKVVDLGSLQKTIIPGKGLSLDNDGNLNITYDHTIFKIVESLPAAPALGDENKVYFVLSNQSEEGNIYSEYLWIGDMWEKMGEFKADIDLSPYLTKEEASTTYLSKTDAESTYTKQTDAEAVYAKKTDVEATYAKKTDVEADYVKKEDGKGLSTNDYTTDEKSKLEGVEAGAEVNVIESVSVNGSVLQPETKGVNIDIASPIATAKNEAVNASKVTVSESAGIDNVLKVYTFTQNGAEIGKINVPKDLVVSGGSIVEMEGVKYLRLNIANQTTPVDIAVTDLVDVYKGSAYITIASDNTISVNFSALDSELVKDTSEVGKAIKANKTAIQTASSEASAALSAHNTNGEAHTDIRTLIANAISKAETDLSTAIANHNTSEEAHASLMAKIQEYIDAAKSIDASLNLLIEQKDSLGNATATSLDIEDFPTINGLDSVIVGSGAPTTAPGFIGQEYLDTTNKKCYKAFGYESTANWVVMN